MKSFNALCTAVTLFFIGYFVFYMTLASVPVIGWSNAPFYALAFSSIPLVLFAVLRRGGVSPVIIMLIITPIFYHLSFAKWSPLTFTKAQPSIMKYATLNPVMGELCGHIESSDHQIADSTFSIMNQYSKSWIEWEHSPYCKDKKKWSQKEFEKQWHEFIEWFKTHEFPRDGEPPTPYYFDPIRLDKIQRNQHYWNTFDDVFEYVARKEPSIK